LKTILVTGGAGFIGSHFIEHLLAITNDIFIVNIDNLTYAGKIENMPFINHKSHLFIKGDITDSKLVNEIFSRYYIDEVYNFAAESHVDNSITNPGTFIKTNVLGTMTLLNAAKEFWIEKDRHLFVQISTDEVYGSIKSGSFKESDTYNPASPYSASKASADLLVTSYHITYGIQFIITRSVNNFGPRQYPEKLIPLSVKRLLSGKNAELYGDGKNIRDWIFVKDNCKFIWLLSQIAPKNEIYNIGADNHLSNFEMVSKILEILSYSKDRITYISDRLGHDFRYSVDFSKMAEYISIKKDIDEFYLNLKRTISSYKIDLS